MLLAGGGGAVHEVPVGAAAIGIPVPKLAAVAGAALGVGVGAASGAARQRVGVAPGAGRRGLTRKRHGQTLSTAKFCNTQSCLAIYASKHLARLTFTKSRTKPIFCTMPH